MKQLIILLAAVFLLHHSSQAQTCGTTNIALTKSTSATSYADAFSMSSMAVDGNTSIPWKSDTSATASITVDLGQSYSICQVKLYWPAQFYYASAYTIYVSDDEVNWDILVTANGSNGLGDGEEDIINQAGVGRYVKLSCTQKGASWANRYELNEFEVYVGTTPPTNNPPSVSITSPSNNSSAFAGGSVTINAEASDNDGSITKVEFYNGSVLLGSDTASPYSYTWNNLIAGSYTITAKAIDDDSAVTTSAAVALTVNSPGTAWLLTGNAGTDTANNFLGTTDSTGLIFKTSNHARMFITNEGRILVNTNETPDAEAHLAVKGNIWAMKLKITQDGWADYVFDSSYRLRPLQEVEQFISRNKHLPDVPSAAQVKKDGLNVGDNQATLLRKIEELTLYLIEQDKKIKQLEAELRSTKK